MRIKWTTVGKMEWKASEKSDEKMYQNSIALARAGQWQKGEIQRKDYQISYMEMKDKI